MYWHISIEKMPTQWWWSVRSYKWHDWKWVHNKRGLFWGWHNDIVNSYCPQFRWPKFDICIYVVSMVTVSKLFSSLSYFPSSPFCQLHSPRLVSLHYRWQNYQCRGYYCHCVRSLVEVVGVASCYGNWDIELPYTMIERYWQLVYYFKGESWGKFETKMEGFFAPTASARLFACFVARVADKQTDVWQRDRHTYKPSIVTLAAHVCGEG